jgi:hypothetical protein
MVLLQGYGSHVATSGDLPLGNGVSASGLLGARVVPHVWLMASYNYAWYGGEGDLPGWKSPSYFGMLGYDIVPSGMNGNWIFYVGAGGVTLDPDSGVFEKSTFFALNGGTKLVYDASRRAAFTVDLGIGVVFTEDKDGGGDTWFYPIGVGIAFRF